MLVLLLLPLPPPPPLLLLLLLLLRVLSTFLLIKVCCGLTHLFGKMLTRMRRSRARQGKRP